MSSSNRKTLHRSINNSPPPEHHFLHSGLHHRLSLRRICPALGWLQPVGEYRGDGSGYCWVRPCLRDYRSPSIRNCLERKTQVNPPQTFYSLLFPPKPARKCSSHKKTSLPKNVLQSRKLFPLFIDTDGKLTVRDWSLGTKPPIQLGKITAARRKYPRRTNLHLMSRSVRFDLVQPLWRSKK